MDGKIRHVRDFEGIFIVALSDFVRFLDQVFVARTVAIITTGVCMSEIDIYDLCKLA